MANKKYKLANNDYWATDGVYDFGQSKTQRQINSDLDGAISALNTYQTGNITGLIANATLSRTTCQKTGNVVTVSGRLNEMTTTASGDFFNIPSGFRPRNQVYVNGYIKDDSNNTVVPVYVAIESNGNVNFAYNTQKTTSNVFFAGTYAI